MNTPRLLRSGLLIIAAALLLVACSSTGRDQPPRVFPGARIAIITESVNEANDRVDADSFVMDSAGSAAAKGALGGVILGAQCGPAFMFCIPFFSFFGGATGLVAGGLYASANGVTNSRREILRQVQQSAFATRSPIGYLEESFINQARGRWNLVTDDPEFVIVLRLEEIRLVQNSKDSFSLRLTSSFAVVEPTGTDGIEPSRTAFEHTTGERELQFFLDRSGYRFLNEFEDGIDTLAFRMVYSL